MSKTSKILFAAALGAGTLLATQAIETRDALAQDATSGAIQGVVTDAATGEPLPGVTVVITGEAIASQTVITDENGYYKVTSLPPGGDYMLTYYYADITLERRGITVGINKTAPVYVKLDSNDAGGETIVVEDSAPTIDPTSTTQGITLDTEYLEKIPVPGRTFESALGAAAGSQSDGVGVAFSGSTSLENQYVVDGVNTTGLTYGTSGSPIINNFIEEIEVITGGYNAEYGRATGGVINVVTKSGSNEIAGSVWGYITPGALIASRVTTPSEATSIDVIANVDYVTDFGFEIGGPIIKDKAWFWVGFAPQYAKVTATRTTKRRADCRETLPSGELNIPIGDYCTEHPEAMWVQDGDADIDPATGFRIYEELDTTEVPTTSSAYSVLGKVNFAVSPEHQGQVSVTFQPQTEKGNYIYGKLDEQNYEEKVTTTNAALKWTSKFNDNKTEVEAVVGLYRLDQNFGSPGGDRDGIVQQYMVFGDLGNWAQLGGESTRTLEGCRDNVGGDPYGVIENCPDEGVGYSFGGPGNLANDFEQRVSGRVGLVQRVKAMGTHEIKAGADLENNEILEQRAYSGDLFLFNILASANTAAQVRAYRWVKLGPQDADPNTFDQMCTDRASSEPGNPATFPCQYLAANDDAAQVRGQTINWSAYLRDSWQIRPNLTVNAGMRYEEQRLRYSKDLRNSTDPLTGRELGTNAMLLNNLWAPRLGVLYDWTKEGRSKIYTHWGRFYESIPMDINTRSFGGEVQYQQWYNPSQCGGTVDAIGGVDPTECPLDGSEAPAGNEVLFGSGVLVAPGIKPQYMDETIFGLEYEILEDLKLGIAYQNRRLGRVIEDVSTDGAQTYIIANPGEWSDEEEAQLVAEQGRAQTECDETQDEAACDEALRLNNELRQFQGIRVFDKPQRDYNALQFTVTRRFSKALYMQGSYTYSRAEGNFPGLYSPDNGQIDPNISSQYDLIELLANRNGPLPQDRPHYVKLDGYYTFDLKKAGQATAGIRFRALSGVPVDVVGRHFRYGVRESFLLPRGEIRRTDFDTGLDVHFDYGRDLGKGIKVEIFADLFNVFNDQGTFSVDESYTYQSDVNPIVGGTYEDLIWAKQLDASDGSETSDTVIRNPNFGNTARRYAPFQAQIGARMTF